MASRIASAAAPVSRYTGIWPGAGRRCARRAGRRRARPWPGTVGHGRCRRGSARTPAGRSARCGSARRRCRRGGSSSWSSQRRRVSRMTGGLSAPTAKRYQNPSFCRATQPPASLHPSAPRWSPCGPSGFILPGPRGSVERTRWVRAPRRRAGRIQRVRWTAWCRSKGCPRPRAGSASPPDAERVAPRPGVRPATSSPPCSPDPRGRRRSSSSRPTRSWPARWPALASWWSRSPRPRAQRRAGARRRPGSGRDPGRGVFAVCADLPALDPAELSEALHAAACRDRAFVVDSAGTGTTVLSARPGQALEPAFGLESAERMRPVAPSRSRRSCPSVRQRRRRPARPGRRRRAGRRSVDGPARSAWTSVAPVQATVASFDEETGSGTVMS